MTADPTITLNNSITELHKVADGLDRLIAEFRREVDKKNAHLQNLIKARALIPDYERLMVGEMAK